MLQQTPDIAAFTRRTGSELGLFATQQNKGDILVRLKPRGERRPAEEVINDLREKLTDDGPQLEIEFVELLQDMIGDLEGAPTPIELKVFGDDPEALADISERAETLLEGRRAASSTSSASSEATRRRRGPSIKATAGRLGLTVAQVSEQLSDAWLGRRQAPSCGWPIAPFRCGFAIRTSYRFDPHGWRRRRFVRADGKSLPLALCADSTTTEGEIILQRENLRQMALVTGTPRRPRPWQRGQRDSGEAAISSSCRSGSRPRSAANTRRSDNRSAS